MKLRKVWEKYQMAIAFAEAGEEKMARHLMEDVSEDRPASAREDRGAGEQGNVLLRPSTAEG